MPASAHSIAYRGLSSISTPAPTLLKPDARQLADFDKVKGMRCYLQISDLGLDWPSRAKWLPKWNSLNSLG